MLLVYCDVNLRDLRSSQYSFWGFSLLGYDDCVIIRSRHKKVLASHLQRYPAFLPPVKDELGLKTLDVDTILCECGYLCLAEIDQSIETTVLECHNISSMDNPASQWWQSNDSKPQP
jgi:hypothetical protein